MTEHEWLSYTNPERMLPFLRGKVSDRKALLVAAAAYRRGHVWAQTCQQLGDQKHELGSVPRAVELAEGLADGLVSCEQARAEDWNLWCCAEEFSLVPGDSDQTPSATLGSAFVGWSYNLTVQCVDDLLKDCFVKAWQAGRDAAWSHWCETVKNHPWLSDEHRVRDHLYEQRARLDPGEAWEHLLAIAYHDRAHRLIDYWDYASRLGKHETRTETWDALWKRAWLSAWEVAWVEGWGSPWRALWTSINPDVREQLDAAWQQMVAEGADLGWQQGPWQAEPFSAASGVNELTSAVHRAVYEAELVRQAGLLRDIVGNPFRPVAVDQKWLTSTVVELARGIYWERAFDRLPILAGALQDAGCDNINVLDHCRSLGPHVRGCWVVDLLLGKE